MMPREIAAELDRSFTGSLGIPDLNQHRTNDVFFQHKRTFPKALQSHPAAADLRSHSVMTPAKHMRVVKDFNVKYEDIYMNHAAKLRERSRGTDDSLNYSLTMECKTPTMTRLSNRAPSMTNYTSNSSFKTTRNSPKVFEKQSANFIAHAKHALATEKENTSGLFNKARKDIARPQPDPFNEMERGVFSQGFVKDALEDYKQTEKTLFIHTNAGSNFRHRLTLRKLL